MPEVPKRREAVPNSGIGVKFSVGICEQFLMAATAQNLKRLVKHLDRAEAQPFSRMKGASRSARPTAKKNRQKPVR